MNSLVTLEQSGKLRLHTFMAKAKTSSQSRVELAGRPMQLSQMCLVSVSALLPP